MQDKKSLIESIKAGLQRDGKIFKSDQDIQSVYFSEDPIFKQVDANNEKGYKYILQNDVKAFILFKDHTKEVPHYLEVDLEKESDSDGASIFGILDKVVNPEPFLRWAFIHDVFYRAEKNLVKHVKGREVTYIVYLQEDADIVLLFCSKKINLMTGKRNISYNDCVEAYGAVLLFGSSSFKGQYT